MSRPLPVISRDEAEMLVDLCENTHDKRLWWLAEELRRQWGMGQQTVINGEADGADIAYLGLKRSKP